MGQKVNPHGLRVGVIQDWDSKWYAEKEYADFLVEDHKIRTFLKKKLYASGVSKIDIERASDRVKVIVYTAKPGVVIGKGGAEIEKIKAEVQKLTDKKLVIDIKEVKRPDEDAQLVAENIAQQLENRTAFRTYAVFHSDQGVDFDHFSVVELLHSLFDLVLVGLDIYNESKCVVCLLHGRLSGEMMA